MPDNEDEIARGLWNWMCIIIMQLNLRTFFSFFFIYNLSLMIDDNCEFDVALINDIDTNMTERHWNFFMNIIKITLKILKKKPITFKPFKIQHPAPPPNRLIRHWSYIMYGHDDNDEYSTWESGHASRTKLTIKFRFSSCVYKTAYPLAAYVHICKCTSSDITKARFSNFRDGVELMVECGRLESARTVRFKYSTWKSCKRTAAISLRLP